MEKSINYPDILIKQAYDVFNKNQDIEELKLHCELITAYLYKEAQDNATLERTTAHLVQSIANAPLAPTLALISTNMSALDFFNIAKHIPNHSRVISLADYEAILESIGMPTKHLVTKDISTKYDLCINEAGLVDFHELDNSRGL